MTLRTRLLLLYLRTKFKILSALSKKKAAEAAFTLFCTPPGRHSPPLPELFQKAEPVQFNFDDLPIRGFFWKSSGKGLVLIVHGFQSSSINFEAQISSLLQAGHHVMAFDAPAHGASGGRLINALLYSDFLVDCEKRFGPFDAVIAHSLGGLAIGLALEKWPVSALPALVLIAPAVETSTALDQHFALLRIRDQRVRQAFEDVIVDRGGHEAEWFSLRRLLTQFSTEVLWFHDEDDSITPIKDAERVWEMSLPFIEVVRTKGLGHRRIYRDPSVIKRATEFCTAQIERRS